MPSRSIEETSSEAQIISNVAMAILAEKLGAIVEADLYLQVTEKHLLQN